MYNNKNLEYIKQEYCNTSKSYKVVASELNIQEGTVKWYIFRYKLTKEQYTNNRNADIWEDYINSVKIKNIAEKNKVSARQVYRVIKSGLELIGGSNERT